MPAYQALDHSLTDPLPAPPAPAKRCSIDGVPTVCALDGLAALPLWQGVLDQCNADRAMSARITAPPQQGNANGPDVH